MQLLVIRHGLAMEQDEWAKSSPDDGLRPLTREGKKKMRQAAAGLKAVVDHIDVLAASPLTRAAETAEIVGDAFAVRPSERSELVPSRPPSALLKWLKGQKAGSVVAIVGHEPHLSVSASWLMTGLEEAVIELKKGAACLIEFEDGVAAGRGKLRWLLTNRHLRQMKEA